MLMARVVVITEPLLAPGYQLAGVETIVARSAVEAGQHLRALLASVAPPGTDPVGVIGVHAPYLAHLDEELQRRIEVTALPVVIALPSGATAVAGEAHRELIVRMLQRAIGYQITFAPEEDAS